MSDRTAPYSPYLSPPPPSGPQEPPGWLGGAAARACAPDPLAVAAGFGRWWLDPLSRHVVLSREAAAFLGEQPGWHPSLDDCLSFVLPDDLAALTAALARAGSRPGDCPDCEFRVASPDEGLRWLRLSVLAPRQHGAGPMLAAILTDITAQRHAAMREQFSFETTKLLIGTHTLAEAVGKVIELVCNDLGWDCGMYWAMQTAPDGAARLACAYAWNGPALPDAITTRDGAGAVAIPAGQGLVGGVWSSGRARWVEDIAHDPDFLFPQYARRAGIHSGYAFPVAYDSADGGAHRPGVLVFFSCLARQRTAQLPSLSAAIGGLIAQTAQRIGQQERIRQLAQVDTLSGLANRRHFHDLLDNACEGAAARGAALGMLYIDLDRFKPINDALGHEVGDAVLRQFALRLAALTPPDGQAGRVGGDEFALFLPAASPERLRQMAELVLAAARTSFIVGGRELAISASVGISVFPDNGSAGADLLRHADSAMYRVKRAGRNGASFFSQGGAAIQAASQSALVQQLTVEAELLHALAGDQLFMQYQPVFDTRERSVRAVEALIRWRRPNGDVVPPDVFIPIAEQSHLIIDIGRWVVRRACRDLATMQAAGLAGVQLNVNMAALEFLNDKLPEELAAITAAAGVEPRQLCLELTEGMMMSHAEQVVPVMRALRQRGFKISVDDFGMGYSSLSRLKDLPISSLKIDRSFVAGLPAGQHDRAIVQTIVDIGRNMGLEVIAEGVETEAQLQHLRELGCTLVQGYLTGRPMGLDELIGRHGHGRAA
ncbi:MULTISPECIES: sensor domain-containing protein [unclassified Janthinobacterium]|uniref:sensor domain-containing protein n=1 Tax=unclassified Janthinobacterium TaxID=2610881 RepID=UPI00034C5D45|nr:MULTISPECIES: bifunctional diguanylate cyclase/phosphodiesterase [unclassified Janthinobacterium]MEC5163998.1 diguanylate cyclase (GGDEF)-like protein [Janthinobacterium sp. CG_S6]